MLSTYTVLSEKKTQKTTLTFLLSLEAMALREHGDEMKAQATESFAADKLKEAEAKASWSVESLGRAYWPIILCLKTLMDLLKRDFVRFVMLEKYFPNHPVLFGWSNILNHSSLAFCGNE